MCPAPHSNFSSRMYVRILTSTCNSYYHLMHVDSAYVSTRHASSSWLVSCSQSPSSSSDISIKISITILINILPQIRRPQGTSVFVLIYQDYFTSFPRYSALIGPQNPVYLSCARVLSAASYDDGR